jgi:hypothetical protein
VALAKMTVMAVMAMMLMGIVGSRRQCEEK